MSGPPVHLVVLLAAWTGTAPILAQQPRDNRPVALSGASSITGIVTDVTERTPLRRARVVLTASDLGLSRTAITADDGAFHFEALPPGRYSLSTSKDGHLTMSFGAAGPGRPGPNGAGGAGGT